MRVRYRNRVYAACARGTRPREIQGGWRYGVGAHKVAPA